MCPRPIGLSNPKPAATLLVHCSQSQTKRCRITQQLPALWQVQYADGEADQLLLAMERVRLLMAPGQSLPQPSAAELQTLADVLRARADQIDASAPPAEGEKRNAVRPHGSDADPMHELAHTAGDAHPVGLPQEHLQ